MCDATKENPAGLSPRGVFVCVFILGNVADVMPPFRVVDRAAFARERFVIIALLVAVEVAGPAGAAAVARILRRGGHAGIVIARVVIDAVWMLHGVVPDRNGDPDRPQRVYPDPAPTMVVAPA